MTGDANVWEPSRAAHLMFRALSLIHCPVLRSNWPTCQSVGTFFAGLTALRVESRPDVGQSAAVRLVLAPQMSWFVPTSSNLWVCRQRCLLARRTLRAA